MSDLPEGWVYARVDEIKANSPNALAIGPFGSNLKVSDYRDEGAPLVFVRNIRAKAFDSCDLKYVSEAKAAILHSHRVVRGDVLVTKMGDPPGDTAIYPLAEQGIVTADCIKLTLAPAVDARYIMYALTSATIKGQILQITQGVAQPKMSLARFRSGIEIPLAPTAEQKRIVVEIEEQFSRFDAGVAALRLTRQNLKRMRAAVLATLLNDEQGKAWPLVELGEVLVRGRYGTSTKCAYEGRGTPVLRIPNVQSGSISLSDMKFAVDKGLDLTSILVEEDDVLIIRTNGSRSLIGRAAVIPSLSQPTAFASYLIQLRINRDILHPRYLVASLASPQMRRKVEQLAATTAGQYNVSLNKLRSLRIPLPPLADQLGLLVKAERQLSAANALASEIDRIQTLTGSLRSSILTASFSGHMSPQDPSDEPASILLERIIAERVSSNGHKPFRNVTCWRGAPHE